MKFALFNISYFLFFSKDTWRIGVFQRQECVASYAFLNTGGSKLPEIYCLNPECTTTLLLFPYFRSLHFYLNISHNLPHYYYYYYFIKSDQGVLCCQTFLLNPLQTPRKSTYPPPHPSSIVHYNKHPRFLRNVLSRHPYLPCNHHKSLGQK